MTTIAIPAHLVSDYDDCFAAAVAIVAAAIPGTAGWDMSPRWDGAADRESVLVDVPDVEIEDLAEYMEQTAGEHGDIVMVALCRLATAGDLASVPLDDADHRALERLGIGPEKLGAWADARAAIARKVVLG